MISNPRHGSPPRLMAHQPTRFATAQESTPSPSPGARMTHRLRRAHLRQNACLENLDLRTPRGLDRALVRDLANCRWVSEHRPILVIGPTGIGKTWIVCALGNQAAREGHAVLYTRLNRLLDDLA